MDVLLPKQVLHKISLTFVFISHLRDDSKTDKSKCRFLLEQYFGKNALNTHSFILSWNTPYMCLMFAVHFVTNAIFQGAAISR